MTSRNAMSGPLTRFGFAEETPEQRQEKILAGVMASVYRQVPQSVLVSIVGAFALVMVLWNSIEQDLLLGWSLLILFESLLRLRLYTGFDVRRVLPSRLTGGRSAGLCRP